MGEDYVADLVKETKRGVADGTIQAFSDKDAFLLHLARCALDKPVTWRVLTQGVPDTLSR